MLRKGMLAAVAAMMLVLVLSGAALAQGYGPGAGVGTPGTGICINGGDLNGDGVCDTWVDADGDGINDNAARDGTGSQYGARGANRQAMANGQAIGGSQVQSQYAAGQTNFVDGNGDGVCDNFVDADGDGVSDGALRSGIGNQHGRHGR
jgi:hypothetical protein